MQVHLNPGGERSRPHVAAPEQKGGHQLRCPPDRIEADLKIEDPVIFLNRDRHHEAGQDIEAVQCGVSAHHKTVFVAVAVPVAVAVFADDKRLPVKTRRKETPHGVGRVADGTCLRVIGNEAFRRTSLKSVTLPQTVITIGDMCFSDTSSLSTFVFCEGSELQHIGIKCFKGN